MPRDDIQVGDRVHLRSGRDIGTVRYIIGGRALVEFDNPQWTPVGFVQFLTVALRDLVVLAPRSGCDLCGALRWSVVDFSGRHLCGACADREAATHV